MQRYKLMRVLGDGTFGVVTLAKAQDTGEMVAIKKYALVKLMLIIKRKVLLLLLLIMMIV